MKLFSQVLDNLKDEQHEQKRNFEGFQAFRLNTYISKYWIFAEFTFKTDFVYENMDIALP